VTGSTLTTDLGARGEPDVTSIVLDGVPKANATLLLDFVFASRELPEVPLANPLAQTYRPSV
jgi:hypothetical protein